MILIDLNLEDDETEKNIYDHTTKSSNESAKIEEKEKESF